MDAESVVKFCQDFKSDPLCQRVLATESQPHQALPAQPSMPPKPSGLPASILLALPFVMIGAALHNATKGQAKPKVPVLAFNGVADLPKYQPPPLPRMPEMAFPGSIENTSGSQTNTLFQNQTEARTQPDRRGEHTPSVDSTLTESRVNTRGNNTSDALAKPFDMAGYMADHLGPTLVTACPRTGKGAILQRFWRLAKDNGISVWVLQPKPSTKELAYWEGVDRFLPLMLENFDINSPDIAKQMKNFVLEWRQQQHRPTVLIVDEMVKIQALQPKFYEWLKSQVLVEMSSGETDDRFIYLVTQSPLVGDIGLSGGNRAIMNLVALARRDKPEHLNSLRKSITSVPEPDSNLYGMSQSPKKAVVYHSNLGNWHPMPCYEMPVSKFNDSGIFIDWFNGRSEKGLDTDFQSFKNASKTFSNRSRSEYERLIKLVNTSEV